MPCHLGILNRGPSGNCGFELWQSQGPGPRPDKREAQKKVFPARGRVQTSRHPEFYCCPEREIDSKKSVSEGDSLGS
jgi:hypothetical protein